MRSILYIIGCLLLSAPGFGQVGAGTLFLQNGVIFTMDSLVLIPSTNTNITGNVLNKDYISVPGWRKYLLNLPINYTGEVGIFYSDAELAGNPEGSLQIAFRNSGTWTTTATSTVNPATNYVSFQATGVTFDQVTATTAGITLPITYNSFSAALKDQYVQLNWQMGEVDDLDKFEIEYSHDGRSWSSAGSIADPTGMMDFSFRHNDLNFTTRHYRIASLDFNGNRVYSRIVTVFNGSAGSSMRVVRSGSSTLLYFNGPAPSTVQVYDMKGQLLLSRNVKQQQTELTGLIPGTYVIHYVVEGQRISRKVQL
jgi:hypothetical protein